MSAPATPRAVIVLVGSRVRALGQVPASACCDLRLVDDLLRLLLAAKRVDRRVVLVAVDAPLRALLGLVGVADLLGLADQSAGCSWSASGPSTSRGGSPNSENRSG